MSRAKDIRDSFIKQTVSEWHSFLTDNWLKENYPRMEKVLARVQKMCDEKEEDETKHAAYKLWELKLVLRDVQAILFRTPHNREDNNHSEVKRYNVASPDSIFERVSGKAQPRYW